MYIFAERLLKKVRAFDKEYCHENAFKLSALVKSKLARAHDAGRVIKQLIFNNMRLLHHDYCDRKKKVAEKAEG